MLKAGAASVVINNEIGRPVQGATVDNVARSVRDDLEANALYLSNGGQGVLFVSCDVAGLPLPFIDSLRRSMGRAAGIPAGTIIVGATHTHAGPSLLPTNYRKQIDTRYMSRLRGWLKELAREAVAAVRPAQLGWGLGSARIGYNRRLCWADGTHTMFGDASRADFTGLEGPDDAAHVALFVRDTRGVPVAVLHNNTAHPVAFYGADFYSADFPGTARTYIREVLGEIPVLFFNGAFGDIANIDSTAAEPRGQRGEQVMLRMAHIVAGETLRLHHEAAFSRAVAIAHVSRQLPLRVRLPTAERVKWARGVLAAADSGRDVAAWDLMFAYGTVQLDDQFRGHPVDRIPLHAVRIGDIGFATIPCELYCQFGLDIKRRSPAGITAILGEANGAEGYVPTTYGPIGGGYSGEPLHWTRFESDAGYRIVDAASGLLHRLWR